MKSIVTILRLTILAFLFCTTQMFAANFYWVGGSGNWADYNQHWATQSGGQVYWAHVPTPTDTVIFDSLSFTGLNDTVVAEDFVYCHTMKWLVSDSLPLFVSGGNNPVLRIYGSLLIDSTTQWSYGGKIIFCAIGPGNSITTNGAQLITAQMRGDTAASWELHDTLRVGYLSFSSGNFYSRGQTLITTIYEQGYTNLSRQYLDTSDVYCYIMRQRMSPLYFDGDSARIIVSGDSMQGGNQTYRTVEFLRYAGLSGNNTIDTFRIHSNADIVGTNTIGTFESTRPGVAANISGNISISTAINFNGACSGMSSLAGSGTIDFLFPGAVMQTVFIDGLSATGNPTVNNSVVLGANGWTSTNNPTPRNLYWVNGQGNWSDTLHWSTTSGGQGNECSPTPIDNVRFDVGSFSQANEVSTADNHVTYCESLVCNGTSGLPNIVQDTGRFMCFGDLVIQDPVIWSVDEMNLRSSTANTIIDVANNNLQALKIIGSGTFIQMSPIHATCILITGGNFKTSGYPITALWVMSDGMNGDRDFGGSTVYAPRWSAGTFSGLFTAPDSLTTYWLYDLSMNNYNTVYCPANLSLVSNCTFNDFTVVGSAEINGSSTFDTLSFTGTDIEIVLFPGTTQTITGDLVINSDCATPVTIRSEVQGQQAYISKANGVINCDYLILEDIAAIGGATFNATNTCALQNVSGWNITPPPSIPMFWIGGTGDWKDPQHWSYSSGGSPAGCIPHVLTDVYFDGLSFSSGGSVNMNLRNGYCRNMDWTGTAYGPSFSSASQLNRMNIFGSAILEQGVSTYGVNMYMRAQSSGNIIDPKNAMVGNIIFNGIGGSWLLNDTLGCDTLDLQTGALFTNSNALTANVVMSFSSAPRELHLDSSDVKTGNWFMPADPLLILDARSAFVTAMLDTFLGGQRKYREVALENQAELIDADTFEVLRLRGSVSLMEEQHIDSLFLEAVGGMISLGNDTIYVDSCILSNSNSSSYIGMQASSPIDFAYISKAADTVCLDYLILQGIDASGGATFFAGSSSSDVANNNGWQWQTCAGQITVWPGDANYDLNADNFDILSIGVAFGETGSTRANASLNWMAQPAYVWHQEFADSTDIVHADCDGDGIIGWLDTTAVSLNYGQTHPPRLAGPEEIQSVGTELKLLVTQAAWQPGDTVTIPIWLGTQNSPANNVYGLAFTINWDYPFVEPGTLEFDYSNSWMLGSGNNVHLEKPFYNFQYCDLGMSRIDHNNVSGTGELVTMRFVLTQNANGPLKFWFTDYEMIDHSEDTLAMFTSGGTINAAVGIEEYNQQEVSAYPNPTNGSLTLNSTLSGQGTITLYDVTGRIAMQTVADNVSTTSVNLEGLDSGYYFLVIENAEGTAQVRIQKL